MHEQHNLEIEGPELAQRGNILIFLHNLRSSVLHSSLLNPFSVPLCAKLAQLRSLKAYGDDDDAISKIVMITESSKEELIKFFQQRFKERSKGSHPLSICVVA